MPTKCLPPDPVLFLDRYAPVSLGGLRHAGSVGSNGVGIHTYTTSR